MHTHYSPLYDASVALYATAIELILVHKIHLTV